MLRLALKVQLSTQRERLRILPRSMTALSMKRFADDELEEHDADDPERPCQQHSRCCFENDTRTLLATFFIECGRERREDTLLSSRANFPSHSGIRNDISASELTSHFTDSM